MARVPYCREHARLCRELADQISNPQDAQRLRTMAFRYDTEADALEGKRTEKGPQTAASTEPDGAA